MIHSSIKFATFLYCDENEQKFKFNQQYFKTATLLQLTSSVACGVSFFRRYRLELEGAAEEAELPEEVVLSNIMNYDIVIPIYLSLVKLFTCDLADSSLTVYVSVL